MLRLGIFGLGLVVIGAMVLPLPVNATNENDALAARIADVEDALSEIANRTAALKGDSTTQSVQCDPFFIVCQCTGVFACAWLSVACADVGGITGFDGECFLPSSVAGADEVLRLFDQTTNYAEMHARTNELRPGVR
jgi:hypothetical protein